MNNDMRLFRRLLARLRKSALRVDRRAKKPFRTLAKARGIPKKKIKSVLHRPKPPKAKTAAMASESPEKTAGKALTLGAAVALALRLKGIGGQLRTTGGRRIRRK